MVIHAMCDEVMILLMNKLGLQPDRFKLKRRVKISIIEKIEQKALLVEGIDSDGTPYSLFSKVEIKIGTGKIAINSEPFITYLCSAKGTPWYQSAKDPAKTEVTITLHFQGHYEEPSLTFVVPLKDLTERLYKMEYNPLDLENKKWDNIELIKP